MKSLRPGLRRAPTHAHFPWVQRGVALGIILPNDCVQGPSGNCFFSPDNPITHGDTSLIIVRGFLKGGS